MKEFIKEQLEHKSEKLNKLISNIDNDIACELSFKIKNALEMLKQEQAANKPLIITLLGGTGVGKSYIFSALHGMKDLSPSSDDERAFTKKLIVSCEKSHIGWAPAINSEDLIFTDEIFSHDGLMVIDTPDIDTDNISNKRMASEAVKASDIVVYVTTPDKMRDFSVLDFLKKWSGKKLWYFVVNKAELFEPEKEAERKTEFTELLKSKFGKITGDFSKYIYFFHGREKNADPEFLRFQKSLLEDKTTESTEAVHDKEKLNAFARISDSNNGNTISSQIEKKIAELTVCNAQLEERYANRLNEFTNDTHVSEEIKNSYIHHFSNAMCGKMTFAMAPFFATIKFLYRNKNEEDLNKRLNEGIITDYQIQKCYSDEKEVLAKNGFNIESLQKEENALTIVSQNKVDIAEIAINEANSFKWDFKLVLANAAPMIFFCLLLYHSIHDWITGNWLPTNFFVHGCVIIVLSAIIGFSVLWSGISKIKAESLTPQKSSEKDETPQTHFPLINTAIARLTEINIRLKNLCDNAREWRDKTSIPENYGLEIGK